MPVDRGLVSGPAAPSIEYPSGTTSETSELAGESEEDFVELVNFYASHHKCSSDIAARAVTALKQNLQRGGAS